MGNPNTGKSTLFNALTGLKQKVANYPGVTVEKHTGEVTLPSGKAVIVDLPGAYSLAARSPDELLATDVLLGRMPDLGRPDAVLAVADAANLERNLFLVTQVLELGLPVVLAVNMLDVASARGIEIDVEKLSKRLGVKAVPVVASQGQGLDALLLAIDETLTHPQASAFCAFPAVKEAARQLALELDRGIHPYEVERALVDAGGYAEKRLAGRIKQNVLPRLEAIRSSLCPQEPLAMQEARARYGWIRQALQGVVRKKDIPPSFSDRLDKVLAHPLWGIPFFVLVMAMVFQAVFSLAPPLSDAIDGLFSWLSQGILHALPSGALSSFLADGVIGGVGSVLTFLPQIVILFAFLILLEDSGYMARAAFLMDRPMRAAGLSGHAFIPLMSCFACAVPGIMGTRVIAQGQDRLVTILAAPFLTCSARLPVYTLFISAFIAPKELLGFLNVQGLVLLGLYALGIFGALGTALLIRRVFLRAPVFPLILELPPYRAPRWKDLALHLKERSGAFLTRAGTTIFAVVVAVWALAYFPRPPENAFAQERALALAITDTQARSDALSAIEERQAQAHLARSVLGRLGHALEPLVQPLGWDGRLATAVLASFPAREIVVAALGTIYGVAGAEDESQPLALRLQEARNPQGQRLFTLPVVLGFLVFYAFCLQCAATLVTMAKETGSLIWPLFAWIYMTALGYAGAWLCARLLSPLFT